MLNTSSSTCRVAFRFPPRLVLLVHAMNYELRINRLEGIGRMQDNFVLSPLENRFAFAGYAITRVFQFQPSFLLFCCMSKWKKELFFNELIHRTSHFQFSLNSFKFYFPTTVDCYSAILNSGALHCACTAKDMSLSSSAIKSSSNDLLSPETKKLFSPFCITYREHLQPNAFAFSNSSPARLAWLQQNSLCSRSYLFANLFKSAL